jgi:Family of unknown function (DUF5984)
MPTQPFKIHFALDDLADVEPWGKGDEANLHWFGLTQGRYWIETPIGDVLRYTPEIQAHLNLQCAVVDYQVARLFEDLHDRMPAVLEPVPPDIAERCSDRGWHDRLRCWTEEKTAPDRPRWAMNPERWELYHAAMGWWSERSLDTAYLRCGPVITLWRVEDAVNVRWTTRNNLMDGIEVFAIPEGDVSISVADLERAASDFFEGVLSSMAGRLRILQNGARASRPCRLDMADITADHARRDAEFRAKPAPVETDWLANRTHLEVLRTAVNAA